MSAWTSVSRVPRSTCWVTDETLAGSRRRLCMRISPALLDAGRCGRDVGVRRDGDAEVVEAGPAPGLGAVLALVGVAGHDAAEPQRPASDGPHARLLLGELHADALVVVDEHGTGLGQVSGLLEQF